MCFVTVVPVNWNFYGGALKMLHICVISVCFVVFCFADVVFYRFHNATTKSLAYYCENYRGRIPAEPHSSDMFPVYSSEVNALKVGGCDSATAAYAIDACSNLRTLDLSHSDYVSINAIPLKTPHLETLTVAHNWLMEIPWFYFKYTPHLVDINFSFNQLERLNSFDFEGAVALKRIHFNRNRIHLISYSAFEKLPKLEFVDLSENAIQYGIEAFRSNLNLKVLNLAGNPIWALTCDYLLPIAPIQIDISFDFIRIVNFQCEANPLQLVTNSGHEGILATAVGRHEIHCNERCQFIDMNVFHAEQIEIQNITELMQHFGSKLQILSISDSFVGFLNATTMKRFRNLREITLIRTNLSKLDIGMLSGYDQLETIDISNNPLKRLNHLSQLDALNRLTQFTAVENEFEHADEIIHRLPSSMEALDLSGNWVNTLPDGSFIHLENLRILNLSNTNLSIVDTNPFAELNELIVLDISGNYLSGIDDFAMLASTLRYLDEFYATDCNIRNKTNLIEQLGSSLTQLYLSNNDLDDFNVDAGTFQLFRDLQYLHLDRTNLINFPAKALHRQTKLIELNLANNRIETIDFRFVSIKLTAVQLQGNNLVRIERLHRQRFHLIHSIDISKNRLTYKHLATLIQEWNGTFANNPWHQKQKQRKIKRKETNQSLLNQQKVNGPF